MRLNVINQSLWEESSTPKHNLGDTYEWQGRIFQYVKAVAELSKGASLRPTATARLDIEATHVATNAAAEDSLYGKMAISQVIDIDDAGATVVAGSLTGMIVYFDAGTGAGQAAWILGNTAGASGSAMKIYLCWALTTAASTDTTLVVYTDTIVDETAASTAMQIPVGVSPANITITINYYFWMQKFGLAIAAVGGTASEALRRLSAVDNTAGQAGACTAGITVEDVTPYAIAQVDNAADDAFNFVYLMCY